MSGADVLLLIALLLTGAMAGLWYGWVVSVIPGTRVVADDTYVSTMQSINREIINPGFLLPFFATPVVLGAAAIVHFGTGDSRRAWWLVAATASYVIGVLGVTVVGNVPLNNELADFDLASAGESDKGAQRTAYEGPWNRWHGVRTGANLVALALVGVACLVDEG